MIIEQLTRLYDLIGFPRLVRLNPNIPWKTRGNGAMAIQVGKGCDQKIRIGESNGKSIWASLTLIEDVSQDNKKHIREIVKTVVEEHARMDDEQTNPGFVLLNNQPDYQLYQTAVTDIVSLKTVITFLESCNADYEGYNNQRGLIGATSAIAWNPTYDHTYELITYRQKKRWGTNRIVNERSVKKIDKKFPTTFDNYDYQNHHNRLMPNSPCPILFGVRGDSEEDLVRAFSTIESEPWESWLLFETNQGTDQHLQQKQVKDIQKYLSVITEGTISQTPKTIQGGHVLFTITDTTGSITCAAYEPTKEFRNTVRGLRLGDIVEVYGGVREEPLTINLEKILVKHLSTDYHKIENPLCPHCHTHMKSKGKNQEYKCKHCGTRSNQPIIQERSRTIQPGFYETPVCARRHLSKPLKRQHITMTCKI